MARVVVAEDNAALLSLFTTVLSRAGHQVWPCRDGAAALQQTRAAAPDLLLTDVDMPPGMSGLELVAAVRDDPGTAHIPVVVITGSPGALASELPALTQCLEKPVPPEQLLRTVEAMLATPGP